MQTLAIAAGLVAGLIHVWFWVVEVFLFRRSSVQRGFGINGADHAAVARPVFFNLGFYNLFLAAGAFIGAWMLATDRGAAVLAFAMAFMLAASVVLLASSGGSVRGPLIQGVVPAIALTALLASPTAIAPQAEPSAAPGSLPQITATADVPSESPIAPEVIDRKSVV